MQSSIYLSRLKRLIVLGSVVACAAASAVGASASQIAAPDVVERYAATHDPNSATAPDVVERYLTVHSLGTGTAGTEGIVAARDVPPTSSGRSDLHWGDFAIGAGAMLGVTLLAAGLGLGAVAKRHRGGRLGTS
jgi:hypothetical protein